MDEVVLELKDIHESVVSDYRTDSERPQKEPEAPPPRSAEPPQTQAPPEPAEQAVLDAEPIAAAPEEDEAGSRPRPGRWTARREAGERARRPRGGRHVQDR